MTGGSDTTVARVERAAREAYAAGLSIVPTAEDGSKRPLPNEQGTWKVYAERRPTPDEIDGWYPGRTGLGVIAGAVSNQVEAWDFDDREAYEAFVASGRATGIGHLIDRIEAGYCDDTPSGGVRWLLRYPRVIDWKAGKLACRPTRPGERRHENDGVKTLIELPLHAIVAPTNGRVHPKGLPYVRRSGGFGTIIAVNVDEREALIALAQSFDQMPKPLADESRTPRDGVGDRPGDIYNVRATWAEVLRGWTALFTRGQCTYWRRPGKAFGHSATTNHQGSDLLYVFSTSTPFTADRGYDKFGAYALLNHNGDCKAAARELAARGYSLPDRASGTRTDADVSACPTCGRESCDGHGDDGAQQLPAEALADAVEVALEGRRIAADGIPFVVDGIVPGLGMLGFLVAYAKVGKTTFGQALAAAVCVGRPFLERKTNAARVLVVAAEDPPEYTAWLARHLDVPPGRMSFYRRSILLDRNGLAQIENTVRTGGYGLVLIASWQAVIRGLVSDENDNAGAVNVVENVKAAARATGVPWLIDAHSGKGEDQTDDADPSRAMRGASAAAGAADYTLSLRYGNGTFGTQRRLSGRGRFVSVETILMDYDGQAGQYAVVSAAKNLTNESIWRQICEMGALTTEPRTTATIALAAGILARNNAVGKTQKRQVAAALGKRDGVLRSEEMRYGKKTSLYRLADE
jgi:hypothetical protein